MKNGHPKLSSLNQLKKLGTAFLEVVYINASMVYMSLMRETFVPWGSMCLPVINGFINQMSKPEREIKAVEKPLNPGQIPLHCLSESPRMLTVLRKEFLAMAWTAFRLATPASHPCPLSSSPLVLRPIRSDDCPLLGYLLHLIDNNLGHMF
jgi:hypothetical protein